MDFLNYYAKQVSMKPAKGIPNLFCNNDYLASYYCTDCFTTYYLMDLKTQEYVCFINHSFTETFYIGLEIHNKDCIDLSNEFYSFFIENLKQV